MAKRRTANRKPKPIPVAAIEQADPAPLKVKPWTFLLYFCGDTSALREEVRKDVLEVAKACKAGLDQVHVVLQHDSPDGGARRYIGSDGQWVKINEADPVRVNTGDPQEAIDFLTWGLKLAPSRHVAVIFSGQGIRLKYAFEILQQRDLFVRGRSATSKNQDSPFEISDSFSICHDEVHRDALDVTQLKSILQAVTTLLDRPVDLVVFDAGCTAFIEIAYQLRSVALAMVAPRGLMPDSGLPYLDVLRSCNKLIQKIERLERTRIAKVGQEAKVPSEWSPERVAIIISRVIGRVAAKAKYPAKEIAPELVVVDLQHTAAAVQLVDYVAATLLNQLGDWHVLNAVRRTQSFIRLTAELGVWHSSPNGASGDLPSADLFRWLCTLEAHLESEEAQTPARFGQLMRLRHVRQVVRNARLELVPQRYLNLVKRRLTDFMGSISHKVLKEFSIAMDARWTDAEITQVLNKVKTIESWFGGCKGNDKDVIPLWVKTYSLLPSFGLLIVLPLSQNLDAERETSSSIIRGSNYNSLDFCRDAGWTNFLGALQLILEKPHALWRMINSFLISQNEQTRSSTLRRFLESSNVLSGISEQFRGFRSELAITLSLDASSVESSSQSDADEGGIFRGTADREEFIVRLQSFDGSPRIQENLCPIYRSTTQSALRSFERLLNSGESVDDAMAVLRQLGRSLGEDIIQDLGEPLSEERRRLENDTSVAPHLRFQIPMHLMRYPWELMSDQEGLLFERFAMGRQFFTRSRLPRQQPRSETALRVLILGDPQFDSGFWNKNRPHQLSGAVREAHHIVDLFREFRDDLEGVVEVWIEAHIECVITVSQVRDLIRSGQYDIIHFAGHACFNEDDPEGSAWLLSDGLLHAREIRNTLHWTPTPPWLVYANACEAGMEGGDSARSDGLLRYQGDVCGLGSAFTNHGVRGYLAPLWPINDDVALQIASDFYRGLLIKRFSLGEALFKAKQDAKTRLLGIDGRAQGSLLPAQVALSWASLVLYGEPTQRLFQSLWSGSTSAEEIEPDLHAMHQDDPSNDHFERWTPTSWKPQQRRRRFMPRIQQASARSIVDEMNGMGLTAGDAPVVRGGDGKWIQPHKALELVEVNGIRFWQIVDPATGLKSPLPGSNLQAQVESPVVRDRLGCNRGFTDYVRVIGKWAVNLVVGTAQDPLELQLARQFDKGIVPEERLVEVREDSALTTLRPGQWKKLGPQDRVILIIHGTFSQAKSPVNGFDFDAEKRPSKFFRDLTTAWAKQNKTEVQPTLRVLAFDHWTLSKSPLDNAADMAKALYDLDPHLLDAGRLDLIVHSRGGLVARSFVELTFETAQERTFPVNQRCAAVRRVIFMGTPNAGTQLANPVNAGRLADFLVNLAHLDEFGFFARMSGLLAQVVVHEELSKIPGLRAQNPINRDKEGELLHRLHHKPTTVFDDGDKLKVGQEKKYWCVAANYEPFDDKGVTDLTGIGEHLKAVGLDEAFDAFYNVTNDLVVDTHGVWAFRKESQQMLETTGPLPGTQVLLYNPTPASTKEPSNAQRVRAVRVHHCNLFMKREVRQFVQDIVLEK